MKVAPAKSFEEKQGWMNYMKENSGREEIPLERWIEYQKNPTKEFQQLVVETYSYIPRTIAYRFARKKPHLLDMEDLIQAGMLGLVQAIDRYDPKAGAKFNTFATFRIRGAILDQINKVDWTPRPVRERIKKVIRVIETLNNDSNDNSNDATLIASHIDDMTVEEVEKVLQQLRKTYITHIDSEVMSAMENNNLTHTSSGLGKGEHLRAVMNMVLDFKERTIIELKFFGGYKDYEIAEKLGISSQQLHRLEKQALEKLSHNLTDEDFS